MKNYYDSVFIIEKETKLIKIVKEQEKCESVPMCSIISVVYCT